MLLGCFRWPALHGIAIAVLAASCQGGAGDRDTAGSRELAALGTLSLQLSTRGEVDPMELRYAIEQAGRAVERGRIRPATDGRISVLFSLAPGDAYTITLETIDAEPSCSGSAPFEVTARAVTTVSVVVRCDDGERLGSVRVDGEVNHCPSLGSVVATPLGGPEPGFALAASGTDPDDGPLPLRFTWSGGDGQLAARGGQAELSCASAGVAVVEVTLDDGDPGCDQAWTSVELECARSELADAGVRWDATPASSTADAALSAGAGQTDDPGANPGAADDDAGAAEDDLGNQQPGTN